ncbi:hypothetical protein HAX54_033373, partial [Datura stramonium]|nr:hypothetical protein [Datura stramonium]
PKGVDEEDIGQDIEETFFKESLEVVLLYNDGKASEGLEIACHVVTGLRSYSYQLKKLLLDPKNHQTLSSQQLIIETPELELKPLPAHL